MNVHFVVYSALIKIMNSICDVFPTVLLMIFARVFCSFSIMSGCYPKFAEDYLNSIKFYTSIIYTSSKMGTLFLVMLRYMEPAAISFSGRENFIAKF